MKKILLLSAFALFFAVPRQAHAQLMYSCNPQQSNSIFGCEGYAEGYSNGGSAYGAAPGYFMANVYAYVGCPVLTYAYRYAAAGPNYGYASVDVYIGDTRVAWAWEQVNWFGLVGAGWGYNTDAMNEWGCWSADVWVDDPDEYNRTPELLRERQPVIFD